MLVQACGYLVPHWIKYEIDTTSTSILCGGYEVRVTRDEDDLRDEITFGQRSNIETNTHIDSLLRDGESNIAIGQALDGPSTRTQILQYSGPQRVFTAA